MHNFLNPLLASVAKSLTALGDLSRSPFVFKLRLTKALSKATSSCFFQKNTPSSNAVTRIITGGEATILKEASGDGFCGDLLIHGVGVAKIE